MIFRDDATQTVAPAHLLHRHKLTPYAGRTLRGIVESTYVRGQRVWHQGALESAAPTGRTLQRTVEQA